MSILSPSARVTIARLVSGRCPQPYRVRRRLPGRFRVFTPVTLTPNTASTASLIWVLLALGGDDEGVLALVEQPVALLRDHRPQQDVPRVADPAHLLASFADLETNAVRACSVKTTWSLASTS